MKYKGRLDSDSEALYLLRRGTCPFTGSLIEKYNSSIEILEMYYLENGDVKIKTKLLF